MARARTFCSRISRPILSHTENFQTLFPGYECELSSREQVDRWLSRWTGTSSCHVFGNRPVRDLWLWISMAAIIIRIRMPSLRDPLHKPRAGTSIRLTGVDQRGNREASASSFFPALNLSSMGSLQTAMILSKYWM